MAVSATLIASATTGTAGCRSSANEACAGRLRQRGVGGGPQAGDADSGLRQKPDGAERDERQQERVLDEILGYSFPDELCEPAANPGHWLECMNMESNQPSRLLLIHFVHGC